MHLKYPIQQLLRQLQEALEPLTDHQYTAPIDLLSTATIGQHVRHILEFFQELDKGYDSGTVNYDRRSRSHLLEISLSHAIRQLSATALAVDRPDKDLILIAHLTPGDPEPFAIRTNYSRELLYNIEHMVHHMALLRIGIAAVAEITLPAQFGVAASTIQFRQTCAQ
ncbi:hypothetical protein Q4E93_11115 [Flavitalea sp. BT771]|uniref:hypothetical protein n=1 Tax=Flavitalea sp. BT771 TaxID=3063329 RepID=UPI0026E265CD|nr:hypothetical protein [Flavitalea sp. BT771]MDO6431142.1 hypothetical protein [Flavitalea sp. BT771]MDV6220049.1 hypothetical protein [Flavitalea sp. BT771]